MSMLERTLKHASKINNPSSALALTNGYFHGVIPYDTSINSLPQGDPYTDSVDMRQPFAISSSPKRKIIFAGTSTDHKVICINAEDVYNTYYVGEFSISTYTAAISKLLCDDNLDILFILNRPSDSLAIVDVSSDTPVFLDGISTIDTIYDIAINTKTKMLYVHIVESAVESIRSYDYSGKTLNNLGDYNVTCGTDQNMTVDEAANNLYINTSSDYDLFVFNTDQRDVLSTPITLSAVLDGTSIYSSCVNTVDRTFYAVGGDEKLYCLSIDNLAGELTVISSVDIGINGAIFGVMVIDPVRKMLACVNDSTGGNYDLDVFDISDPYSSIKIRALSSATYQTDVTFV